MPSADDEPRANEVALDPDLAARVRAWIAADPDPATRGALEQRLADATDPQVEAAGRRLAVRALEELFGGRLAFGTAGLRAELGPGPRRMNRVLVRQTAAGLAAWLRQHVDTDDPTVVIGYDARHNSDVFAHDTARVVAAAGARALLLPHVVPTPVLAFAVRHLGADAGVMCTASHNPPQDNGYKVYLGDGAQIIPPVDREIAGAIDAVAAADSRVALAPPDDPRITVLDTEVVEAYVDHAVALPLDGAPAEVKRGLSIVYTPMHGVGRDLAVDVLARTGFDQVYQVVEQAEPDPDFPTVAFPNPEEPGALDLALAEARRIGADLVLAHDPDADRLGVAVPVPDDDPRGVLGWRVLSGNEIGALLGEHVLSSTTGRDRLVVSTFVSSRLLAAMAAFHGAQHEEVLTGFKWIVRPAIADPTRRFVFGYEEALGFSVDAFVRDKDGITAGRAFVELVTELRADGRTVDDVLELLDRRHGHHASATWSVRFAGADAATRLAAVLDVWRARPPRELAGRAVVRVTDMATGGRLPPTDAVVVDLEGGGRVIVRPSGTEPKVKVYVELLVPVPDGPDGHRAARVTGAAAVGALREAVTADLGLPG